MLNSVQLAVVGNLRRIIICRIAERNRSGIGLAVVIGYGDDRLRRGLRNVQSGAVDIACVKRLRRADQTAGQRRRGTFIGVIRRTVKPEKLVAAREQGIGLITARQRYRLLTGDSGSLTGRQRAAGQPNGVVLRCDLNAGRHARNVQCCGFGVQRTVFHIHTAAVCIAVYLLRSGDGELRTVRAGNTGAVFQFAPLRLAVGRFHLPLIADRLGAAVIGVGRGGGEGRSFTCGGRGVLRVGGDLKIRRTVQRSSVGDWAVDTAALGWTDRAYAEPVIGVGIEVGHLILCYRIGDCCDLVVFAMLVDHADLVICCAAAGFPFQIHRAGADLGNGQILRHSGWLLDVFDLIANDPDRCSVKLRIVDDQLPVEAVLRCLSRQGIDRAGERRAVRAGLAPAAACAGAAGHADIALVAEQCAAAANLVVQLQIKGVAVFFAGRLGDLLRGIGSGAACARVRIGTVKGKLARTGGLISIGFRFTGRGVKQVAGNRLQPLGFRGDLVIAFHIEHRNGRIERCGQDGSAPLLTVRVVHLINIVLIRYGVHNGHIAAACLRVVGDGVLDFGRFCVVIAVACGQLNLVFAAGERLYLERVIYAERLRNACGFCVAGGFACAVGGAAVADVVIRFVEVGKVRGGLKHGVYLRVGVYRIVGNVAHGDRVVAEIRQCQTDERARIVIAAAGFRDNALLRAVEYVVFGVVGRAALCAGQICRTEVHPVVIIAAVDRLLAVYAGNINEGFAPIVVLIYLTCAGWFTIHYARLHIADPDLFLGLVLAVDVDLRGAYADGRKLGRDTAGSVKIVDFSAEQYLIVAVVCTDALHIRAAERDRRMNRTVIVLIRVINVALRDFLAAVTECLCAVLGQLKLFRLRIVVGKAVCSGRIRAGVVRGRGVIALITRCDEHRTGDAGIRQGERAERAVCGYHRLLAIGKRYGIQTADRRERAGFLGEYGQVRRRGHIAVVGRCGCGNGNFLLAVAVKVAAGKRHDRDFLNLPLPLRCLLIRGGFTGIDF